MAHARRIIASYSSTPFREATHYNINTFNPMCIVSRMRLKNTCPPKNGGSTYTKQVSSERVIKDTTWHDGRGIFLLFFAEGPHTDLNGYNFDVVEISSRSGGVIYTGGRGREIRGYRGCKNWESETAALKLLSKSIKNKTSFG